MASFVCNYLRVKISFEVWINGEAEVLHLSCALSVWLKYIILLMYNNVLAVFSFLLLPCLLFMMCFRKLCAKAKLLTAIYNDETSHVDMDVNIVHYKEAVDVYRQWEKSLVSPTSS